MKTAKKDTCHGYLLRMLVVPAFSSAVTFFGILISRITDWFFSGIHTLHIFETMDMYLYIIIRITIFIFVVSVPIALGMILLRWFKCKSKQTIK